MSDESPSAREREEAEALARALEGHGTAPDDALEVAGLLRYARGGDLPTAEQLARARKRAESAPVSVLRRRPIAVLAGALATAAVALLAVLSTQTPRSAAPVAHEAPSSAAQPGSLAQLLDAQADALARPDAPLTGLAEASARHRRELLAGLEARYGGGP